MVRRYYSLRTGKHPDGEHLTFETLLKLFFVVYCDFDGKGYFQEAFGYDCVDAGWVPGKLGTNINAHFIRRLRKDNLWPIEEKYEQYNENDLFDVIEFMYDHVSKPISGRYHSYGDCGYHYDTFEKRPGQDEFRQEINDLLRDYGNYELSNIGEIFNPVFPGTEELFNDLPANYDPQNVGQRIEEATRLYRRHGSSPADRKQAIIKLTEVLEFLRPQIKKVLTRADENDLFNIANNFGIRHHNKKQKTDYDESIWLDWIFYYYLATINAVIRLIDRETNTTVLSE